MPRPIQASSSSGRLPADDDNDTGFPWLYHHSLKLITRTKYICYGMRPRQRNNNRLFTFFMHHCSKICLYAIICNIVKIIQGSIFTSTFRFLLKYFLCYLKHYNNTRNICLQCNSLLCFCNLIYCSKLLLAFWNLVLTCVWKEHLNPFKDKVNDFWRHFNYTNENDAWTLYSCKICFMWS